MVTVSDLMHVLSLHKPGEEVYVLLGEDDDGDHWLPVTCVYEQSVLDMAPTPDDARPPRKVLIIG
jgi:hypothetical protein